MDYQIIEKKILMNNGRKTDLCFWRYGENGLCDEIICYVETLTRQCQEEYKGISISKVRDFYDADYGANSVQGNFLIDPRGKKYTEMGAVARYNNVSREIHINHIQAKEFGLRENKKNIAFKDAYLKLRCEINDLLISLKRQEDSLSMSIINQDMASILIILDVFAIRYWEQEMTISRVIYHEFGHALDFRYSISARLNVLDIYKKCADAVRMFDNKLSAGVLDDTLRHLYEAIMQLTPNLCVHQSHLFKNTHELIAECFAFYKFVGKVGLANSIVGIINSAVI